MRTMLGAGTPCGGRYGVLGGNGSRNPASGVVASAHSCVIGPASADARKRVLARLRRYPPGRSRRVRAPVMALTSVILRARAQPTKTGSATAADNASEMIA